MVIRLTDTFQRRIHVDSMSTFTLRLVRWIFYVDSTSTLRRLYVGKYLCGHGLFFNVESTSKSLCAEMVYFSTSIQRWYLPPRGLSIHQRRIYVDSTSRFPHGRSWCFDIECTSIQRWYFPINKTCRFFNVEFTATLRRGFPTAAKGTSSGTLRSLMMSLLPFLTLYTSGAKWKIKEDGSTRLTRFKRKFTSNYLIVSWPGAPERPLARWT